MNTCRKCRKDLPTRKDEFYHSLDDFYLPLCKSCYLLELDKDYDDLQISTLKENLKKSDQR